MNTVVLQFSGSQFNISDDIGRAVYVLPLNLYHRGLEEIYIRVDLMVHPTRSPRDTVKAHCRALVASFLNFN